MGIKSFIPDKIKKIWHLASTSPTAWEKERKRLLYLKRFEEGISFIQEYPIRFSDSLSFLSAYEEIFIHHQYASDRLSAVDYIIDAGSNIGLSILYFKTKNKNVSIVGIEPDPYIFTLLSENIGIHHFENIKLINAALWKENGEMNFESDKTMSGHLSHSPALPASPVVQTITLSSLIDRPVDFLKIDIEGAELACLEEAADKLHLVDKIFVEYHSNKDQPQALNTLLEILAKSGFRYYIREAFCSRQPFMDISFMGENDLQLNIFGVRPKQVDGK